MNRKIVFYFALAFCAFAFSPSLLRANGCSDSEKQDRQSGLWDRLTQWTGGKSYERSEKSGRENYGKKCGWRAKSGDRAFWWRSSEMAERIGLDENQVAQLDEISNSYRDKMTAATEKMSEAKWNFKKVMDAPESSAGEIRSAAEKMYKVRTETERIRLEKKLAMRQALSARQIEDMSILKSSGHKRGCGFGKERY